MNRVRTNVWMGSILIAAAVLAGCATPPGGSAPAAGQDGSSAPRTTRPLTFALRIEPIFLSTKGLRTAAATTATTSRLFNAGLAYIDDQSQFHPYLAESLPRLNTESWKVYPDGRMDVVYHLKPGLTWHDGAPLTADDYVFSLKVYQTP